MVAEVVAGELHLQPRPRFRHARSASRLGILLGPADMGDDGVGGSIILDKPELHLSGDVLVPDLAGWPRETMPELPDEAFSMIRPDWLCEVLSPSTAKWDRADKVRSTRGKGSSTFGSSILNFGRWRCSAWTETPTASSARSETMPRVVSSLSMTSNCDWLDYGADKAVARCPTQCCSWRAPVVMPAARPAASAVEHPRR